MPQARGSGRIARQCRGARRPTPDACDAAMRPLAGRPLRDGGRRRRVSRASASRPAAGPRAPPSDRGLLAAADPPHAPGPSSASSRVVLRRVRSADPRRLDARRPDVDLAAPCLRSSAVSSSNDAARLAPPTQAKGASSRAKDGSHGLHAVADPRGCRCCCRCRRHRQGLWSPCPLSGTRFALVPVARCPATGAGTRHGASQLLIRPACQPLARFLRTDGDRDRAAARRRRRL